VLNVTVSDAEARFISGLDRGDFHILEDGLPQEILSFAGERQPIALSLLLDTSTSMDRRLAIAQEAAVGFAKRLGSKDVAQFITFDTRPNLIQDFTNDRAVLERAIRRTQVGGSTALYNALYIAFHNLKEINGDSPNQFRRQAIIVLTDGLDTSSVIDYDSVLDSAKRSEVGVYAISLRVKDEVPQHGFDEADYVLRALSQETGGRVFHVDDPAQLPAIYQQVADELASQYFLSYVSKNGKRDGQWRRIQVRVDRPNVTARTKSGYYAPKSSQ
jgi:Ca-activated chloride channel homolog